MTLPDSANRMPSRTLLLCLGLMMLFGALLRTVTLHREAVEGDELFSRRVALMPVGSAYQAIREDLVHPPLYYYVLKATTGVLGSDAFDIRALSLFCGILSIGLLGYLGSLLPDARYTGLLAAFLLAVNGSHIFYSQQARSYAFYTFVVMLLLLWVHKVGEGRLGVGLWAVGVGLMSALVYTHYVASIYVACAVLAVLLSSLPRPVKLGVLGAAIVSAIAFIPWITAILGVYRAKHGVGQNLDWQGHPDFYALKMVYSDSLGVMDVRGGTTVAFLGLILLVGAAIVLTLANRRLRANAFVLSLLFLAVLPPVAVFVLSNKPINLPLFGLRHVLPSLALLSLLAVYGLELLYRRTKNRLVLLAGAAALLCVACVSTAEIFAAGPTRIPYDRMERDVVTYQQKSEPAYTAWEYGEGDPVNFYCASVCVSDLPGDLAQLPARVVFLYRPGSPPEMQQFDLLRAARYTVETETYYTSGQDTKFGVEVAEMARE